MYSSVLTASHAPAGTVTQVSTTNAETNQDVNLSEVDEFWRVHEIAFFYIFCRPYPSAYDDRKQPPIKKI